MPPTREWVYFVETRSIDLPLVCIGKTRGPVRAYLCSIQSGSPVPLKLTALFSAPDDTKRLIHRIFRQHHSHSDWFFLSPEITDFVRTLPKGEPLPLATHLAWQDQANRQPDSSR